MGEDGLCVCVSLSLSLYPYEGHIIDFRLHGNVNDCKSGKCEAPSCGCLMCVRCACWRFHVSVLM